MTACDTYSVFFDEEDYDTGSSLRPTAGYTKPEHYTSNLWQSNKKNKKKNMRKAYKLLLKKSIKNNKKTKDSKAKNSRSSAEYMQRCHQAFKHRVVENSVSVLLHTMSEVAIIYAKNKLNQQLT